MATTMSFARSRFVRDGVTAMALVGLLVAGAMAQESAKESAAPSGYVDFDCPGAPEATVEFDLSQGMFTDLFGIGEAAVSGIAESVVKAFGSKPDSQDGRAVAEQVQATRQMLELFGQVVQGVRVRVYEIGDGNTNPTSQLTAYYREKLRAKNWESVLKVRCEDGTVAVSILRKSGAIKGVFVIAGDDENTVLTNLACDISPETIKKLTSAAATIGVKVSLNQMPDAAKLNFLWSSHHESEPTDAKLK